MVAGFFERSFDHGAKFCVGRRHPHAIERTQTRPEIEQVVEARARRPKLHHGALQLHLGRGRCHSSDQIIEGNLALAQQLHQSAMSRPRPRQHHSDRNTGRAPRAFVEPGLHLTDHRLQLRLAILADEELHRRG